MAITRNWDDGSHGRISGPLEARGREVIDRLPQPVTVDYVRLDIDAIA